MGTIRETSKLHDEVSSADERQLALASITELEAQYAAGEVELRAYFMKKRALIRAL